jgi:hypothetical protein
MATRTEVETAVAELDEKLAHVLEAGIRTRLVREALLSRAPEEAYALASGILHRSPPTRGSAVDLLRDALYSALLAREDAGGQALPYAFRAELYRAAHEAEDDQVMRVLRSSSPMERADDAALRLPKEVEDIPLGTRRTLAKGADKDLLDLLALDWDPTVIANLLRNPKIIEEDVVRIAARRPVAASSLIAVYECPRWSRNPRVRVALARNPYTPVDVAIQALGTIPLANLREMRRDPDLHPDTRHQVEDELARRSQGGFE